MKFLSGFLTAIALVFTWVKWSKPYRVWQFSRGDM